MKQYTNCGQRQTASQRVCRPQRCALRVHSLHKALRKPKPGPLTAPADVVYECLTLFRRPDLESLAPFLPPGAVNPHGPRVGLVVGGQVVEEQGPLARCHTFMDTAARRVLPGHLLRRCRVLSSMQLGELCQQRVALTACTGEEAVFVWRLRRVGSAAQPGFGSGLEGGGVDGEQGQPWGPSAGQVQQGHPPAGVASSSAGGAAHPAGPAQPSSHLQGQGRDYGVLGTQQQQQQQQQQEQQQQQQQQTFDSTSPVGTQAHVETDGRDGGSGEAAGVAGGADRDTSTTTTSSTSSTRDDATSAGCGVAPTSTSTSTSAASIPESTSPPSLIPRRGGALDLTASCGANLDSDSDSDLERGSTTAWIVESIARDDSYDDDELPPPGPAGGGPHPRCSPELVVKAQLAALRRGDVAGAASFNLWSRSTSGGWDLHLSAFRALLRQPSYTSMLEAEAVELGPSAMPTPRRMLQEVRLRGGRRAGATGAASQQQLASQAIVHTLVYQLGMQANGCWVVEAIRAV